jgi:hypothetical protein
MNLKKITWNLFTVIKPKLYGKGGKKTVLETKECNLEIEVKKDLKIFIKHPSSNLLQ